MKFNLLSCEYGETVIQQRYILTFMTFMAIVNSYTVRMCLHISITEIAEPTFRNSNSEPACPGRTENVIIKGGTYKWSERQQGIILLSFFPGYLFMHLPAGYVADVYGGRHVLAIGVLVSAIITIFTPLIIHKLSWIWLAFSRFLLGLAQAGMYPAITSLLARWIPSRHRSVLGSLVYSGIQVGIISGTLFTGLMISYYKNWPVVFYVWGILCFVWYVVFLLLCYSDPDSHPHVTEKEKEMLDAEFGHRQRLKTPWWHILKDKAVWALILAQCGHDWITYTVEIDMPKYFKNVLNMDIANNSMITSAPFFGMWICSAITGYLSDYLINRYKVQVVTMRIIYTTISSAGPSIFSLIATYMECNTVLVVTFFWIGMISMGPYYSGLKVNVLDLSLNFSGVLIALSNGFGVITGIAAPYVVAEMAAKQTIKEWQNVFWVSFVICTATNIAYIIWARGERCDWDRSPQVIIQEEEKEEEEE